MSVQHSLLEDLNDLHASYVEAINMAVAADDSRRVDQLAAGYDADATLMVAEREGLTHLLPLRRASQESPVRRFARRISTRKAA